MSGHLTHTCCPCRCDDVVARRHPLHRPCMPVRLLGRAGPPPAALALRRAADVEAANDRADARAGRGRKPRGRRGLAPAAARHADRPGSAPAPAELAIWCAGTDAHDALDADAAAARAPSANARALDHKLSGPRGERRYSAPSYAFIRPADGTSVAVPGFNPLAAYEVAIAALAPDVVRRPATGALRRRWRGPAASRSPRRSVRRSRTSTTGRCALR